MLWSVFLESNFTRLVSDFWWVPLITVPLLAVALKFAVERLSGSRFIRSSIRKDLREFRPSGDGYWIVAVTLRDGRRFSGVRINGQFRVESPTPPAFVGGDIASVTWEGHQPGAVLSPPRQMN